MEDSHEVAAADLGNILLAPASCFQYLCYTVGNPGILKAGCRRRLRSKACHSLILQIVYKIKPQTHMIDTDQVHNVLDMVTITFQGLSCRLLADEIRVCHQAYYPA